MVVLGTKHIMKDGWGKRDAIEKLGLKYAPDDTPESREKAIDREWKPLCMLEMLPEHISGKEAIELVRQRK